MKIPATRAIVISASSDIGAELCLRWQRQGYQVFGTYRTPSAGVDRLQAAGITMLPCQLADVASVTTTIKRLREICPEWDLLVLCPGALEPVGPFASTDFDQWEESVAVNFTRQLRLVHGLLPGRSPAHPLGPCVLFFAGGGTNNAPVNYSAYTISKVALIKMCELLDAELPEVRFAILGPGWVNTKIHQATFAAGAAAGNNLALAEEKLARNDCTPMQQVLDCCDWLINTPRAEIGGRNFSVVHDALGSAELSRALLEDPQLYKLKRHGNNRLPSRKED